MNLPVQCDQLSHRQKALLHLTLAEAASIDDRMMLVAPLAKLIRATAYDCVVIRELLLGGAE